MILGTGIDIVDLDRIAEIVSRRGNEFLNRIYLAEEVNECLAAGEKAVPQRTLPDSLTRRLAGKFAAKEAFLKALGTGLAQGLSWKNVAVLTKETGAPYIQAAGKAAEIAESLGVSAIHVSISHSKTSAIAAVILESK